MYKQTFHLRFCPNILMVQYQISQVDYKKRYTKCNNCNIVHIHSIAFCKTGPQTKYRKVNDVMPLNTPSNTTLNTHPPQHLPSNNEHTIQTNTEHTIQHSTEHNAMLLVFFINMGALIIIMQSC